jgi:hypothetical protein
LAITGRLATDAGGALTATWPVPANAGARLALVGATAGAVPVTGALRISPVIGTTADCTGRALVKASLEVATMAPGAVRFRYSTTLVTLVVLFTFVTLVMLVTFVTLVTLTCCT